MQYDTTSAAAGVSALSDWAEKRNEEEKFKQGLVKAVAPRAELFGYGSKEELLNDSADNVLQRVKGKIFTQGLEQMQQQQQLHQAQMAHYAAQTAGLQRQGETEGALAGFAKEFNTPTPSPMADYAEAGTPGRLKQALARYPLAMASPQFARSLAGYEKMGGIDPNKPEILELKGSSGRVYPVLHTPGHGSYPIASPGETEMRTLQGGIQQAWDGKRWVTLPKSKEAAPALDWVVSPDKDEFQAGLRTVSDPKQRQAIIEQRKLLHQALGTEDPLKAAIAGMVSATDKGGKAWGNYKMGSVYKSGDKRLKYVGGDPNKEQSWEALK